MSADRPLRILHVVHRLNRGGMQTCIMHFLRHRDPARLPVDFLVYEPEPGDYDAEARALGARLWPCAPPSRPLAHVREARRILREAGPFAAVHCHHPIHGLVLWASRRVGVPVRVTHSHNDLRELRPPDWPNRLYVWALRAVSRRVATHGLAVSRVAAEALFGPGWTRDPRWQVLVSGRDFRAFHQPVDPAAVRAELGLPADAWVVGHVGRLCHQKNHDLFLRTAQVVVGGEPRAWFLLVGDGPDEARLRAQARELGLAARVVFAGRRQDVPRLLLGAMDAFLFPSWFEGLPGALVEAQAAGLPCVFSDVIAPEADLIPELLMRVPLTAGPAVWADQVLAGRRRPLALTRAEALRRAETGPFGLDANLRALTAIYAAANPAPQLDRLAQADRISRAGPS